MADWGKWLELASSVYGTAKPFIDLGVGLYEQGKKNDFTGSYGDFLQSKEQQDYDKYLAEVAAIQQASGIQAGYLQEALALQKASQEQILAMYAPFIDSAKRLLPEQEALARGGQQALGGLWNQVNTPEMVSQINNIPTSAFVQADKVAPKGIIR